MVKKCIYPKCYATKDNKKCMAPNAWIIFQRKNGGKKLTKAQKTEQFRKWKQTIFPTNSSAAQRRQILCKNITSSASERKRIEKVVADESERKRIAFVKEKKDQLQRIARLKEAFDRIKSKDSKDAKEIERNLRIARSAVEESERKRIARIEAEEDVFPELFPELFHVPGVNNVPDVNERERRIKSAIRRKTSILRRKKSGLRRQRSSENRDARVRVARRKRIIKHSRIKSAIRRKTSIIRRKKSALRRQRSSENRDARIRITRRKRIKHSRIKSAIRRKTSVIRRNKSALRRQRSAEKRDERVRIARRKKHVKHSRIKSAIRRKKSVLRRRKSNLRRQKSSGDKDERIRNARLKRIESERITAFVAAELAKAAAIKKGDETRKRNFALKQLNVARSAAIRAHKIRVNLEKTKLVSAKETRHRSKKRVLSLSAAAKPLKTQNNDKLLQLYGPDVFTDNYRLVYSPDNFAEDHRVLNPDVFTDDYRLLNAEFEVVSSNKRNKAATEVQRHFRGYMARENAQMEVAEARGREEVLRKNGDRLVFTPANMDSVVESRSGKLDYDFKTQGLKDIRYQLFNLRHADLVRIDGTLNIPRDAIRKIHQIKDVKESKNKFPGGTLDTHEHVLHRIKEKDRKSFDSGDHNKRTIAEIVETTQGYADSAAREVDRVEIRQSVDKMNDSISGMPTQERSSLLKHLELVLNEPNDRSQILNKITNLLRGGCSLENGKFGKFVDSLKRPYRFPEKHGSWEDSGSSQLHPSSFMVGKAINQGKNQCEIVRELLGLEKNITIKTLLGIGTAGSVFLAHTEIGPEAIKVSPFPNGNTTEFWNGVHVQREIYNHVKDVVIPAPLHAKTLSRRSKVNTEHKYSGVFHMRYEYTVEVRELLKTKRSYEVIQKYARALQTLHKNKFSHGDAHTSNFMERSVDSPKMVIIDFDRSANLRGLHETRQKIAIEYDFKFALTNLKRVFDEIYGNNKSSAAKIGIWDKWMKLFSEAYGRNNVSANELSYSSIGLLNPDTMYIKYFEEVLKPSINLKKKSMGSRFLKF